MAVFAVPYLLAGGVGGHPPFAVFGSAVVTAILLAMVGFIVGLAFAVLLSARVNRGIVRRSAREHPQVAALIAGGWSWEPPGTD